MRLIMDMIHDNPGEKPCITEFRNPEKLAEYGYNTQVYKYFDTTVSFKSMDENFFDTSEAKIWIENKQKEAMAKVSPAHDAGLMTMCHIDLFVLPKKMVEIYRDEICDENGKISIFKDKTKDIYRILLNELFEMYPLDGLIIRVGETYLHDTPYHLGNGAIPYGNKVQEKRHFIELIEFLRQEVCVKHNKFLIFRTWDCFSDKFHANPEYYLDITNNIVENDKLIFSIKHTTLDFWRKMEFNPCIGIGKHKQVIEVQCQREYEGKGAYPSYVMGGVINSFSELKTHKGLKDVIDNPLFCGIYAWSRGGGWYGPYIKNEFWCDLNSYVLGMYAKDPSKTEKEIFLEYACNKMEMDITNAEKFYTLCQRIPDAVLCGNYIEHYPIQFNEKNGADGLWLRDDRIAGLRQLNEVFDYLDENNLIADTLAEKDKSVAIWKEIREIFKDIQLNNSDLRTFIETSIEYAICLFTIVNISFRIFVNCRKNVNVKQLLKEYDDAWLCFKELEKRPEASTCYCEQYIFSENNFGLDETVDYCRKYLYDMT